jgi:hypothetical protein
VTTSGFHERSAINNSTGAVPMVPRPFVFAENRPGGGARLECGCERSELPLWAGLLGWVV